MVALPHLACEYPMVPIPFTEKAILSPLNFPSTQCISDISAFFEKPFLMAPFCLLYAQPVRSSTVPGAFQGNIVSWKEHLLLVGQTHLDLSSGSLLPGL